MKKKNVILGITGCIAAYKAPDLARKFIKKGHSVHAVMSRAATKFITPLTLESITGNQVVTDIFESSGFKHLDLAKKSDLFVVAPSTANFIAKTASGMADDALTTVFLAAECPKIIAPAMNYRMFKNKLTQKNIDILKKAGIKIIEPGEGELACGEEGKGRLADISDIFNKSMEILEKNPSKTKRSRISGKKFVVTAGGTSEKIDAVRCITNRSSGKAGTEIAKALTEKGGEVTLITSKPDDSLENIKTLVFEDYDGIKQLIKSTVNDADCLIMSAAISDFKPLIKEKGKIKREKDFDLKLTKTDDIIKSFAKCKNGCLMVGFAAESENIEKNAFEKLKKKNLDLIIASDIKKEDSGIGKEYCDFILLYPDGKKVELGRKLKSEAAKDIVGLIEELIIKDPRCAMQDT